MPEFDITKHFALALRINAKQLRPEKVYLGLAH
jgi:hypothetical protein